MSQQVNIVAPSNMDAGYEFDAQVDGNVFKVTVPEGGVKAGQEFTVLAPASGGGDAPTGNWRYGLCDCCTCDAQFWMGWCCSAIVLGQLMQRIKLNFLAQPDAEASKNTCMILTVAYGVSYLIGFILAVAMGGAVFTVYPFVIYMIIVITITRMHMRKKYRIPGGVFGDSVLDDCCHAYWCTCCSILQMVRHTHDEKVHQYKFDSKTGLQDDAPDCGGIV